MVDEMLPEPMQTHAETVYAQLALYLVHEYERGAHEDPINGAGEGNIEGAIIAFMDDKQTSELINKAFPDQEITIKAHNGSIDDLLEALEETVFGDGVRVYDAGGRQTISYANYGGGRHLELALQGEGWRDLSDYTSFMLRGVKDPNKFGRHGGRTTTAVALAHETGNPVVMKDTTVRSGSPGMVYLIQPDGLQKTIGYEDDGTLLEIEYVEGGGAHATVLTPEDLLDRI